MSDAITELQRMKRILIVEAVKLGDSHVCEVSVLDEVIDARIAELEAQQAEPSDRPDMTVTVLRGPVSNGGIIDEAAEPSDAEIEAWRKRATDVDISVVPETHPGEFFQVSGHVIKEAVALMRRGRGDKRLREAADHIDTKAMHAIEAIRSADGDEEKRSERRWKAAWSLEQARLALRAALGEQ